MPQTVESQIAGDAAWAGQFQPTNLAQRQRRAAAMAAGEELAQQQKDAMYERELRTDKGARDLFLGRERIRQGDANIGLRQEGLALQGRNADFAKTRFQTEQERLKQKDAFDEEIKLRAAEVKDAQELRATQKALMDSKNALRITAHSTAAEQGIQDLIDSGALPGSAAFAQGALQILAKNPFAEKSLRDTIVSTAKIAHPTEDLDSTLADMKPEDLKRTRVVRGSKGGWTVTTTPQEDAKPKDELQNLRKELDAVIARRVAVGDALKNKQASQEDVDFYDSEKNRIRARMAELQAPKTDTPKTESPAAPTPKPAAFTEDPSSSVLVPRKQANGDIWYFDSVTKKPVRKKLPNE